LVSVAQDPAPGVKGPEFDVPPILTSADAMAFAPLVDGIIMMVEAGETSIHDVNKAISLLPQEKILGLVLNKGDAR
jgi:non-specific protein-tyrosine kinase